MPLTSRSSSIFINSQEVVIIDAFDQLFGPFGHSVLFKGVEVHGLREFVPLVEFVV